MALTQRLFPTETAPEPPAKPDLLAPPDRPRRIPYNPALDGLRGLAVAAVVLYHGTGWMLGGFLGVDAFFVLSGYLITTLLIVEWRTTETIALLQFWGRRVRRLVPALLVVMVGMALFSLFVAKPDNLEQLRKDGVSSLFYVMNWRLIASNQSYFSQFFASPFRHMWSLAIEEQYYIIWPLLTLGVLKWRKSVTTYLWVCLGLAAVSAGLMAVLFDEAEPSRVYYGTDTRAQSLLLGSALAAALAAGWLRFDTKVRKQVVLIGATLVTVIMAWYWWRLPDRDPLPYRGGMTLFALSVCLIILALTQIGPNFLKTAFAFEPLRRLGIISYGVYLYHWPLYAFFDSERMGLAPSSTRLLLIRLTATLIVATVSYVLLEKPIREGALRKLNVSPLVQGLFLPVSAGLVLLLILTSTADATRTTPIAADFDKANRPPPSLSTDPNDGSADDAKVLLVGDSVAYTMGVGFESEVASENGIAVWNQAVLFCELVKGAHRENGEVIPASDTCVNWDSDWRGAVEVFKPEVTVLQIGAWEIFDREIDGTWIEFGTPEFDAILKPTLQRAVDALGSGGAPVVVLTTPRFERQAGAGAQEWTQNDVSRTDHFNALLKELAANNPGKVVLLDFGEYLCPKNECKDTIDGVEIRPDGLHFKEEDAKVAVRWIAPQLRQLAEARRAGTTPGTAPGTSSGTAVPAPAPGPAPAPAGTPPP